MHRLEKYEDIRVLLNRLKSQYKYLSSIGKSWNIAFEFTSKELDQIDNWLVESGHQLASRPGTQEARIKLLALELTQ